MLGLEFAVLEDECRLRDPHTGEIMRPYEEISRAQRISEQGRREEQAARQLAEQQLASEQAARRLAEAQVAELEQRLRNAGHRA